MNKANAWQWWCFNDLNFPLNPGLLSFELGPSNIYLGAQLAPGEKRLVCIPEIYSVALDTAILIR